MWGEGGVPEFCLRFQSYYFGNSGPHAKFQNHSLPPSGLLLVKLIMIAAGNPSNGRCPATYFYSSTSGLVGKWLYDRSLLEFNENCVR